MTIRSSESSTRRERRTGPMRTGRAFLMLGLVCAAVPVLAADPFLRRTTTVRVVEEAGPAVVNITTEQLVRQSPFRAYGGDPFFDRFFQDFFDPRPRTAQNLGSGVLIDARGHILTNEHVVARASRIRISLADGREFDAQLVGADPNSDIAVLRADTDEKLPWLTPGSSRDLMVGEPVIAIGNPFGLSHTVTTGVISALNRSMRTENRVYNGFLQTDASINPGNSGGPLLNAEGKLVAINTAVYNPAHAQGIGFAIPIDTASRIVSELIEHGEVPPVWLGIDFQDLDGGLARALELPEDTRGALVNRVRRESPAQRAGIRRRDVVTHVEGHAIESAGDFFERLAGATAGQELALTLYRSGAVRTLKVRAEEIPDEVVARLVEDLTGLELSPHEGGGFVVRGVRGGTGAARVGLQPGDLLLAINGRALPDPDALRRAVLDLRGRPRALVVVQRGSGRYHVDLPLV
jgi:serine protease Do